MNCATQASTGFRPTNGPVTHDDGSCYFCGTTIGTHRKDCAARIVIGR